MNTVSGSPPSEIHNDHPRQIAQTARRIARLEDEPLSNPTEVAAAGLMRNAERTPQPPLMCPRRSPEQALDPATTSERFELRWVSLLGTNAGFPRRFTALPANGGHAQGRGNK